MAEGLLLLVVELKRLRHNGGVAGGVVAVGEPRRVEGVRGVSVTTAIYVQIVSWKTISVSLVS